MSLGLFEIVGLIAVAATTGLLVVMSFTWNDTFGTDSPPRRRRDRADDRRSTPPDDDQSATVATERTAASTAATVSSRN